MEILVKQKLNDGRVIAVVDGQVNGSSVVEAASDNDLELRLRADGWKTINGSHVLIGKTGRILGGAGNKFTGKVFGKPFNKGKKVLKLGAGQKGRLKQKGGTIKTAEQAVSALRKAKFDIADDAFRGVDKKLLVENAQHILNLEKKFNVAGQSMLSITQRDLSPGVIAMCAQPPRNPLMHNIVLSQKFKNRETLIAAQRKNRDDGYNMRCSDAELARYSVTHEYGHALQNILITDAMRKKGWSEEKQGALLDIRGYNFYKDRGNDAMAQKALKQPYHNIRRDVADKCRDEIIAIAKKQNKKFTLKANISKYGKKDSEEFFAEVFANSQLGEPNELGRAMNIWLEQKGLVMNG